MNKKLFLLVGFWLVLTNIYAQNADSLQIRKIYEEMMLRGKAYKHLDFLCNKIGNRISGSPQAAASVEWTRQIMDTMGLDTVYLQAVMVPRWVRGNQEIGKIMSKMGNIEVRLCALGSSVGTEEKGLLAPVIEVKDLAELKKLGEKNIKGKIVFFNRPMNPLDFDPFDAYVGAVDQRGSGANEAAKYGALGVIVRSMASNQDDFPHTGNTRYETDGKKIPAAAISTNDAEKLSMNLAQEPDLKFYLKLNCQMLPDVLSYNVIGEIRGSEKPDEYIVVGGHLDSWDIGQGAHDDGAGVVQSMEVLRVFKRVGYKPKRTVRAVLFMNEENGLRGGNEYAKIASEKKEKHIAALESDSGGFSPRDLGITADEKVWQKMQTWRALLAPYGILRFLRGGGGADIRPLNRTQNTTLVGYQPEPQRYFNYHHTEADTFDKVDKRELELGAVNMAAIIYLLAEYGIE